MTINSPGMSERTERWDQLYQALAAQPRRMIIYSLLKEPDAQQLSLPAAAQLPGQPMDSKTLRVRLRHQHLPMLADAGYICWTDDPFCVERGPHFEEPALVIAKMTESSTEYPPRLRDECVVIGDVNAPDTC